MDVEYCVVVFLLPFFLYANSIYINPDIVVILHLHFIENQIQIHKQIFLVDSFKLQKKVDIGKGWRTGV